MTASPAEPTPPAPTGDPSALTADLLGVAVDPARLSAVATYLAEVLASADLLRSLDLGDDEPGPVFDASWPRDIR